jgi:hypothetical protein
MCSGGQANLGAVYTQGILTTAGTCTTVLTSGNFLAKTQSSSETSSGSVAGAFYSFSNTDTSSSANVLTLTNSGTGNTLKVTSAVSAAAGSALIFASNTNASPTGNLLDLQAGSSPTSKMSVSVAGAVTLAGGQSPDITVASAAASTNGTALTIQGGTAGSGNQTGGALTLKGGTGTGGCALSACKGGTVNINGGAASSTGAGGLVVISAAAGGSSAASGQGAGGSITLQGGNAAGSNNNDGGSIALTAGTATGTGKPGVVSFGSPVFNSTSESFTQTGNGQSFNVTQSDLDTYGTIVVNVTGAFTGATVNLPSPTNTTAGRVVLISGASTSASFTLGATGMTSVNMAGGNTSTLIWNGTNWSGTTTASSLQQVYNNTSTSPASIITTSSSKNLLFQAGVGYDNANLFQIGNSYAAPVLHVDTTNTATGANLATNGGVETGGTPPTGWSQYQGTGSTVTSFTQNISASNLAAGVGSLDVNIGTTGSGGAGANNDLSSTALSNTAGIIYNVSFNVKVSAASPTLAVQYFKNNTDTTPDATCSVPSNGTPNTTTFFKYTCYFTNSGSTKTTTNRIRIVQTNTSWTGHIYIDNLFLGAQDTSAQQNAGELQVGGPLSQGLTLFQLDSFANDPFSGTVNQNMVGSMYYSTTLGRIQCYEVDGWGSCGAAPDTNLILSPEYAGAVLATITYNGETANAHIGTMTASICSNAKAIQPTENSTLCASGEEYNFYRWTTSQVTSQSYSIFVKYQLPPTFGGFVDANTIKMIGRVSSTTDAALYYTVYRGTTECGGTGSRTTISTSANAWNQVSLASDETACGFQPNDIVTFEIDMYSKNNAYVYASQLTFTMKGK